MYVTHLKMEKTATFEQKNNERNFKFYETVWTFITYNIWNLLSHHYIQAAASKVRI